MLLQRRYLNVDSVFRDVMDGRWTLKQRCLLTWEALKTMMYSFEKKMNKNQRA